MDFSEKPQVRGLRVFHSPHRIHVSGVAMPSTEELPLEVVIPTLVVGATELAGDVVEVPIELVTVAEQTQQS